MENKQKTHSLIEKRDLTREFSDYVKQFRKDNNLSWKELFKIIEDAFLWVREIKSIKEKENYEMAQPVDYSKLALSWISEQTVTDFSKWAEDMVQKTIDFVNSHPDLKEVILNRQKEMVFVETAGNTEYTCAPSLTFTFTIDNLLYSIAENKWVPASDIYMGYYLGRNQEIIYTM